MKADTISYLSDAIARIESGAVSSSSGSHLAGIFGKSANGFEKHIRSYVVQLLENCGMDYERDVRALINGPAIHKATLGQLIAVLKETSKLKPKCVSERVPGKQSAFINTLEKINDSWVQVKHGDEVAGATLVIRMKSMLKFLQQISGAEK